MNPKALAPNGDDVKKLHAEINQLVNQVSLLNIAAIAFFGAILSSMLKIEIAVDGRIPNSISVASFVLLLILSALFYMGFTYFRTVRFIAAYLIYTKTSIWEQHYDAYHQESGRPHFLYSESRAILFALLGAIAAAAPWALHYMSNREFENQDIAQALLIYVIPYFLAIFWAGFSSKVHLSKNNGQLYWRNFFQEHEFVNASQASSTASAPTVGSAKS